MKCATWAWSIWLGVGLGSGIAWAQPAKPNPAPAAAEAAPPKVLVLPFKAMDANEMRDWIGQAIEQAIVTELGVQGIAPAAGEKSATPLQAARDAHAKFVVVGSFQTMNSQVRVLGQILETDKGQVVGTLHMTGPLENLFDIEDVVARQARRQLPGLEAAHAQSTPEPAGAAASAGAAVDDGPLRAAPYYASAVPPLPACAAKAGALALIQGPPDWDEFGYGGCGYCGGGGWGCGYGANVCGSRGGYGRAFGGRIWGGGFNPRSSGEFGQPPRSR